MDLVKEVLKKFFKQGETPEVTVDEIMKTVAAKFNIRIADLKSQKKNKNLVIPRQIAMYLARKLTSHSFPDIGAKIGGKDHSAIDGETAHSLTTHDSPPDWSEFSRNMTLRPDDPNSRQNDYCLNINVEPALNPHEPIVFDVNGIRGPMTKDNGLFSEFGNHRAR